MRIAWISIAVLVALVALMLVGLLLGWLTPVEHVAASRARYQKPPAEIWRLVGDLSAWPSWQPGTGSAERQPDVNGHQIWKTDGRWGPMRSEVLEMEERSRLVTRIADPEQGFGGTWSWAIEADGSGSRVTITENGVIWNPFFRFLSRFLFGYHRTQRAVLQALGAKLGEPPVNPEWVR